jgi:hypothetical protein
VAGPAIALAANEEADREIRLLAVRALGACPDPSALEALLRLADGGRTLLGRARVAARTPEVLAALGALRRGWSHDPKAERLLAAAVASADVQVRRAAEAEAR